jgi:peptide/nickel transport system substrate-binding protein
MPSWGKLRLLGVLSALVFLVAVACAPAAEEPTATTAPEPTATTAPVVVTVAPTATTAAVAVVDVKQERYPASVPVLENPPPNPDAKHGGTLKRAIRSSITSLSTWEELAGGYRTVLPAHDTLLVYDYFWPTGDQSATILPSLATDWYVNEAGDVWTFALQDGVKFTDGTDFTCADAQWMINTIRTGADDTGDELRRSPRGANISRVTDVTCADDLTLKITTDGQLPSLVHSLADHHFTIKSKAYFEGKLALMLDETGPTTGPFIVDEWIPGEGISLNRNPNYWLDPYPFLDRVEAPVTGSQTASAAALRVGNIEIGGAPPAMYETLREEGFLYVTPMIAQHGFVGLQANWQREPWGDVRFSQALECMTDTATYLASIDFQGYDLPIFPLEETPGGTPWGLNREEWNAIGPCHGAMEDLAPLAERQMIAHDLLHDIGFTHENPAVVWSFLWTPFARIGDVAPVLMKFYEDVPHSMISMEWDPIETARAYDKHSTGEFDVSYWSYLSPRTDPDTYLYEHFLSTSNRNYGKYSNPEVDALINLQSATMDPELRAVRIKELSKILLRDSAKITMTTLPKQRAQAPWLKDYYVPNAAYTHELGFQRVWIDQDLKTSLGK